MDQKHAMLYPPLEHGANAMPRDQRISASAAMGLPTEAPPSYDAAMMAHEEQPGSSAGGVEVGWQATAPNASPDYGQQPPTFPATTAAAAATTTRSVIVAQPAAQPQPYQLPQQPQQQQQQQQQHLPTVLPPKLGPNPCAVTCPACGTCKTSRMCYTPNSRTHLCALLLCLVGWCCCACCVPYCMNSCRTGNHYCAKCNTFLGAFNPRVNKGWLN